MADPEHVERLKQGVEVWNAWREAYPEIRHPDLSGANLSGGASLRYANLKGANLEGANLSGAGLANTNLIGANLSRANLARSHLGDAYLEGANFSAANLFSANLWGVASAYLSGADLSGAGLIGADLTGVSLSYADLRNANLSHAKLSGTFLRGANLTNASLGFTVFANATLTSVVGLETCRHDGPSFIDYETLKRSYPLPLAFLRGVGLPDIFIEYLPSLTNQAIQLYSCFISYSTKDQDFAERLHADLQNKGVRCWFSPHDMPIGGKLLDEIDAAIRLRDKVLLILSDHSINSDWVEDEVTKGFEEERKRGQIVLFPIRLDDAVMETNEAWAAKLRARLIGDFRGWEDHKAYKQSLDRVMRDLTISPKVP
jgi:TIR domain/Pentapeptide repeats (8 copies)